MEKHELVKAQEFELRQRQARALAASSLMPAHFQNNLPNVLIALEFAERIGANPLMVAQNLAIVKNRPSLSSSFLIATVNASKRFTPLRFVFQGQPYTDQWGCRAKAKSLEDQEDCLGTLITIRMANAEGWTKNAKWQTMPEQMLIYRAAAFWVRVYAPELSMGLLTKEEAFDISESVAGPVAAVLNAKTPNIDALFDSPKEVEIVEEESNEIAPVDGEGLEK
jgi:hypothetical protein